MYLKFKRLFDIIISFLILIVLSPFLIVIALLIKAESKGGVIFTQKRIGKNGKVFDLYKFRTMCEGAENMGTRQFSYEDDERVTKVGKFLRKYSIDELMQLINVIKGDMSIIGPRPVLTYHPKKYGDYDEEERERFSILPGITGLAQVMGRNNIDWTKRIEYDIFYVKNVSLLLDIKILLKTIGNVISAKDSIKK